MRLALVQFNPTIGDLAGNVARIAALIGDARRQGADAVLLPELAICGYPPRDLLLQEGFLAECEAAAERIGTTCSGEGGGRGAGGMTVILGVPTRGDGRLRAAVRAGTPGQSHGRDTELLGPGPRAIMNSLVVYRGGVLAAVYDKQLLPTYDVFDEDRYFTPGTESRVILVPCADGSECRVGLTICEDLWKGEDAGFASHYDLSPCPVAAAVRAGARVIVSASASPFVIGKGRRHIDILRRHAMTQGVYVASTNQVGGNDELIFDGRCAALDPAGNVFARGPAFEESVVMVEIDHKAGGTAASQNGDSAGQNGGDDVGELFGALVLGVRDYLRKTGFTKAVLGLSGGIDSAVTAAIAARAIGPANVTGVLMPGPYSSEHSIGDALDLAARLGMPSMTIPIGPAVEAFRTTLDPAFATAGHAALGARLPDLTEENLQSRVRGTTLMALSNRSGAIVLTTGNKSEMAVGYCTLYGDMNGGLAVLSDCGKQWVYKLAAHMNTHAAACGFAKPPIPESSITKPPSAELRPDQKDQDSLPPYEVLDEILARYVEGRQNAVTIVRETGFDAAIVAKMVRLIDLSEYKRKQAAIGLKVTGVAFGSGRRWPIASRRTAVV